MDEPHFGEGELALTESIVEDDDTGCIKIMLANKTTSTTIRVHKKEKIEEAIPAITKEEVECAEDSKSNYKDSIIKDGEILAQHTCKGNILPSIRDNRMWTRMLTYVKQKQWR